MKRIPAIYLLTCLSCMGQTDRTQLKAYDYQLFEGTPVWDLAKAIRANDLKRIEELASRNKNNLNFQEEKYGETLLFQAVLNNQFEICKKLLELGADPNIHDHIDGSSAIILASSVYTEATDVSYIKLLLSFGADPNDEEVGPRRKEKAIRLTPLLAASRVSLEKVRVLVDSGADINHRNEYKLLTPLNSAIVVKKYDIALYLLEHGADYLVPVFLRPQKNGDPNSKGHEIYIQDLLREDALPLDSDEYILKMRIVTFLESKGVKYREVPIPDFIVERAKKSYPSNWREYLDRY